jgi:hypothetical protein
LKHSEAGEDSATIHLCENRFEGEDNQIDDGCAKLRRINLFDNSFGGSLLDWYIVVLARGGGWSEIQGLSHLLGAEAPDGDPFVAAGLAGDDYDARLGNIKQLRKVLDDRLVGLAVDWRGGDGEFDRIAYDTGDGVAAGARLHAQRKLRSVGGVADGERHG